MLWVLIRSEYHNICFCGEIRKHQKFLVEKKKHDLSRAMCCHYYILFVLRIILYVTELLIFERYVPYTRTTLTFFVNELSTHSTFPYSRCNPLLSREISIKQENSARWGDVLHRTVNLPYLISWLSKPALKFSLCCKCITSVTFQA